MRAGIRSFMKDLAVLAGMLFTAANGGRHECHHRVAWPVNPHRRKDHRSIKKERAFDDRRDVVDTRNELGPGLLRRRPAQSLRCGVSAQDRSRVPCGLQPGCLVSIRIAPATVGGSCRNAAARLSLPKSDDGASPWTLFVGPICSPQFLYKPS
jgi:hypothetical protein